MGQVLGMPSNRQQDGHQYQSEVEKNLVEGSPVNVVVEDLDHSRTGVSMWLSASMLARTARTVKRLATSTLPILHGMRLRPALCVGAEPGPWSGTPASLMP